ncbi:MAG: DUF3006 domain-containing protein [Thermoleophilia bacterium]
MPLNEFVPCQIDRFEGNVAVLLFSGKEVVFPRELMPADAVEGDHLRLMIERDADATQDTAREISGLQERLSHGKDNE